MLQKLTLLGLIVLAALISACHNQVEKSKSSLPNLEWRDAPEQSKVAFSGEAGNQSVRRCWKQGGKWDCLFVLDIGTKYSANRYFAASLADGQQVEQVVTGQGYDCNFAGKLEPASFGVFAEHIANSRGYLLQNSLSLASPSPYSRPWTKGFATDFMRKNGVKNDKPYFDCQALARQIIDTSLASMASSAISLRELTE